MRYFFIGAALAGLAMATAAPATAAPRGFEAWLDRAVAQNMHFPAALARSHAAGVATVRFVIGRDGRVSDVEIVRSSGHVTIDRAALRTIATLDLPEDAPVGPRLAVLQYGSEASLADTSPHRARMRAAVREARLALRDLDRQRLAGTGGSASAPASTVD